MHFHHAHSDPEERNRYLRLAPLSFLIAVVEFSAGHLSGSIALRTDALHSALDIAENLLNAYVAERSRWLARPDRLRKLGFAGSLILIALSSGYMGYEALRELFGNTPDQLPSWTVGIAAFSLFVNLWQLRIHSAAPKEHRNVNHWGQTLHLVTDIGGSLAAIVGTALGALFGIGHADAWASLGIVMLIWSRMFYGARKTFGPDRKSWHHACDHHHE